VAGASTTRRELLRPGAADVARLQRLMSIELLLLYVYDHVVGSSILPPSARRTMAELQAHERAHVAALSARLRARGARQPPPPPSISTANRYLARRNVRGRLGQLQGADDALHLLLALERVTVGAYFVALREMRDPGLIVLAAQIMASDAQHEAIVGEQLYPGDVPSAVPYGLVQGVQ
jgi:ferritin-like protein